MYIVYYFIKNYKIYSDARDAIVEEEKLVEFTKIIEDFYATSSIKTMQELAEKAESKQQEESPNRMQD